jgi:hypothetical protein
VADLFCIYLPVSIEICNRFPSGFLHNDVGGPLQGIDFMVGVRRQRQI